jgi:hypothetical protein
VKGERKQRFTSTPYETYWSVSCLDRFFLTDVIPVSITDCSVSRVTRLRGGEMGFIGDGGFSLCHHSQTCCRLHSASYTVGTREFFQRQSSQGGTALNTVWCRELGHAEAILPQDVYVQYWALVSISISHILLLILSQSYSAQSNPGRPVTLLSEKSRSMAFIMPKSISISQHCTLSWRLIDIWTMR